MALPFDEYEVARTLRPAARGLAFDLDAALASVVALESRVPADATTAETLGARRFGHGAVIGKEGLVLTIGYLITEAEDVTLTTHDGRQVAAHVLGSDPATGFGLVHALEPLELPTLLLGDSRPLEPGDPLIVAGGGGLSHALSAQLIARAPFAGYWEYLLDEALFTTPAHPHWSGAAVIGGAGQLLGVCSLQMNQQASDGGTPLINMSVPIELLPPILDDLSRGRQAHAPRPWLGVISHEVDDGVMVVDVSDGGPASRAELRSEDVILAVAGEPVSSLGDFYKKLWALGPPGVVAPLTLRREDDVFDVEVRTADRSSRLRKRRFN